MLFPHLFQIHHERNPTLVNKCDPLDAQSFFYLKALKENSSRQQWQEANLQTTEPLQMASCDVKGNQEIKAG